MSRENVGARFSADGGPALGEALGAFLRGLAGAPRLVGFGEPMHGEETFVELRNQAFRHLVEHEGYRSIAIESNCIRGTIVDAFIHGDPGFSLDHVMAQGFSHGFGGFAGNRELVRWMAEYNRARPRDERLRFTGFDAPVEITGADSPRETLSFLFSYLALHLEASELPSSLARIYALAGPDDRWTNPGAAMDPTQSVGGSPDVGELRLIAEDLLMLLASETPRLIAISSRKELWEAELRGRAAAGLLSYHAAMADTSPRRTSRLMAIRDKLMADNLRSLAELEARRGPTFVFAHNQHLLKGESRWRLGDEEVRWWSAGALLAARLGDDYAVIGSALGAAPHQGIREPDPDTLEGLLYTLPGDRTLVPALALAAVATDGGTELVRRTTPNLGYFPLNPDSLGDFDAVAFFKDIAAA